MIRTDDIMYRALGARGRCKRARAQSLASTPVAPPGVEWQQFGDLIAVRQPPMGRIVAAGPDVAEHLASAVDWLLRDPRPGHPIVELPPTEPMDALFEPLARRGFFVVRVQSLLAINPAEAPAPAVPELPPSVAIRAVETDADRRLWAELYERGFRREDEPAPADEKIEADILELAAEHTQPSCWRLFTATVDNQPAGMGSLWHSGDEDDTDGQTARGRGSGFFGNGATIPSVRRCGVHTAMIHTRLAAARDLGLDLVAVDTRVNSASERNLIRAGFQLVAHYTLWRPLET